MNVRSRSPLAAIALLPVLLFTGCPVAVDSADPIPLPAGSAADYEATGPLTRLDPSYFPKTDTPVRLSLGVVPEGEKITVMALHGSQLDSYPGKGLEEVPFSYRLSAEGLATPLKTQKLSSPAKDPQLFSDVKLVQEFSKLKPSQLPNPPDFGKCRGPYQVGATECDFKIIINDYDQEPVKTRLQHESPHVLYFVDTDDLQPYVSKDGNTYTFGQDDLKKIAEDVEDHTLPTLTKYFGHFTDTDHNGKLIIVFSHRLKNRKVYGYASPVDLKPTGAHVGSRYESNEGEIVYLNTPWGMDDWGITHDAYGDYFAFQVISHEAKHALSYSTHFNQGFREKSWLEEPSAVAAQVLATPENPYEKAKVTAKYGLRDPQSYRIVYEFYPSTTDGMHAMYGFNFLLLWRLAEQMGHDTFWWNLMHTQEVGLKNLLKAANETDFTSILEDWALTLLLDHDPNSPFGTTYSYQAKDLNLKDGTWEPLAIQPIKDKNAKSGSLFPDNLRTESVAFHQAVGTGKEAILEFETTLGTREPHFVILRHGPQKQ